MKLYTIERAFFDRDNEVVRIHDYELDPMNHDEATAVLSKLYNKDVYKRYNCIDRLREVK